jgi:hypothetical protein
MTRDHTHSDRRAFGRRAIDMPATARASGGASWTCTVSDLSDGGALLMFSEHHAVPSRFWLCLADRPELLCEVRHSTGTRVGVAFLGGSAPMSLKQAVAPADAVSTAPRLETTSVDHSAESSALIARMRQSLGEKNKVASTSKVAK